MVTIRKVLFVIGCAAALVLAGWQYWQMFTGQ
jgi:hypothetical protein